MDHTSNDLAGALHELEMDVKVSASTIARRETREQQRAKRDRDTARKIERIAELERVAVNSVDIDVGACSQCINRDQHCMIDPGRPKTCLDCVKRNAICLPPATQMDAVRTMETRDQAAHTRPSYKKGTKQWYDQLLKPEKQRYKAEEIRRTGGIYREGGPCRRCVSIGVVCRVMDPNSDLAKLSGKKTTRCGLCLHDDNVGYGNIVGQEKVGRKCENTILTHEKHEAIISPEIGNYKKMLDGEFRSKVDEQRGGGGEDVEVSLPASISSTDAIPAQPPNHHDFVFIGECLDKIKIKIDQLCYNFWCSDIIDANFLPLERTNIIRLNNQRRNIQDEITTASLLEQLFDNATIANLHNCFGSLDLEKLSLQSVFVAIISEFLLETVFLSPPLEVKDLQNSLQHLDYSVDQINHLIEQHFMVRHLFRTKNYTATADMEKKLAGELVDILSSLCHDDETSIVRMKECGLQECIEIVCLANDLNVYLHARPRRHFELFRSQCNQEVTADNDYYIEGTEGIKHGKVRVMQMFGVRGGGDDTISSKSVQVVVTAKAVIQST